VNPVGYTGRDPGTVLVGGHALQPASDGGEEQSVLFAGDAHPAGVRRQPLNSALLRSRCQLLNSGFGVEPLLR
jgi:hypothetical protein